MPFLIVGTTGLFQWRIESRVSVDGRYFASVQVGTMIKVTYYTYHTYEEAKDAGCQLLADTLAELEDLVNA